MVCVAVAALAGQPVWAAALGAGLVPRVLGHRGSHLAPRPASAATWRSASRSAAWPCGSRSFSACSSLVGVLARAGVRDHGAGVPRLLHRLSRGAHVHCTRRSRARRSQRRRTREGARCWLWLLLGIVAARRCSPSSPAAPRRSSWSPRSSISSPSSRCRPSAPSTCRSTRPSSTCGSRRAIIVVVAVVICAQPQGHAGPLPVRHRGALRARPRRHRRLGHEERQGDVVPLRRRRLLLRPRQQPPRPAAAALRRAPPAVLLRRHGQPLRHRRRWRCSPSCSRTTPASARTAPCATSRTGRRRARRPCSSR